MNGTATEQRTVEALRNLTAYVWENRQKFAAIDDRYLEVTDAAFKALASANGQQG